MNRHKRGVNRFDCFELNLDPFLTMREILRVYQEWLGGKYAGTCFVSRHVRVHLVGNISICVWGGKNDATRRPKRFLESSTVRNNKWHVLTQQETLLGNVQQDMETKVQEILAANVHEEPEADPCFIISSKRFAGQGCVGGPAWGEILHYQLESPPNN
jgi:hypothetical protein